MESSREYLPSLTDEKSSIRHGDGKVKARGERDVLDPILSPVRHDMPSPGAGLLANLLVYKLPLCYFSGDSND